MYFESVAGPTIPRYKRSVRGMRLDMQPEKLVKASYSSKRKLDGDTRGLCSDSFPYGPLDRLAENGIVPLRVKVTEVEPVTFIGPLLPLPVKVRMPVIERVAGRQYRSVGNSAVAPARKLPTAPARKSKVK